MKKLIALSFLILSLALLSCQKTNLVERDPNLLDSLTEEPDVTVEPEVVPPYEYSPTEAPFDTTNEKG